MADTPSDPPPDYEKSTVGQGTSPRPMRKGPIPLDLPILKHLNSKRVILASASPRRKALLQQVRNRPPYSPVITFSHYAVWPHQPRGPSVHQARESRQSCTWALRICSCNCASEVYGRLHHCNRGSPQIYTRSRSRHRCRYRYRDQGRSDSRKASQ